MHTDLIAFGPRIARATRASEGSWRARSAATTAQNARTGPGCRAHRSIRGDLLAAVEAARDQPRHRAEQPTRPGRRDLTAGAYLSSVAAADSRGTSHGRSTWLHVL